MRRAHNIDSLRYKTLISAFVRTFVSNTALDMTLVENKNWRDKALTALLPHERNVRI